MNAYETLVELFQELDERWGVEELPWCKDELELVSTILGKAVIEAMRAMDEGTVDPESMKEEYDWYIYFYNEMAEFAFEDEEEE